MDSHRVTGPSEVSSMYSGGEKVNAMWFTLPMGKHTWNLSLEKTDDFKRLSITSCTVHCMLIDQIF